MTDSSSTVENIGDRGVYGVPYPQRERFADGFPDLLCRSFRPPSTSGHLLLFLGLRKGRREVSRRGSAPKKRVGESSVGCVLPFPRTPDRTTHRGNVPNHYEEEINEGSEGTE